MTLVFKILFQILLVLIVFLVAVLDYYKFDKRTRGFKRLRLYLVIFIGLSLIGNIAFVTYDDFTKQQEAFSKQEETNELKRQNEYLNLQINELKLQNEATKDFLTGGGSFCYLELANIDNDTALMAVINQGNHPMYDIILRLVDLNKYDEILKTLPEPTLDAINQAQEIIPVGTLPVNRSTIPVLRKISSDNLRYNIFISARNGQFLQKLRLRKINGKWFGAMKVEQQNYLDENQNSSTKLLLEKIDSEFPKDSNGSIDWK